MPLYCHTKLLMNLPELFFLTILHELNRQSRTPDLRNTLYWNPSVKTNSNGKAEIEFWTSDLPGIYTINIQGIAGTGEKISLYKSFTVR